MPEFKPVRKKLLTRPVLKLTEGVTRFVKIEAAMYVGKTIKEKAKEGTDKKQKEAATLMNVIDLEHSGEQMVIVCNAVLKSVLNEEYPEDTYVGKCFSITKGARVQGKDYNPFNIEEIEDPNAGDTGATASSASPVQNIGGKRR